MIRISATALTLCAFLLLAACEPITPPTTPPPEALPPPDLITTTTDPAPAPQLVRQTYRGVLPNGLDYVVELLGERVESRNIVGGWFMYDGTNGPAPIGEVRYTRVSSTGLSDSYDSGLLRLVAEQWLVEVFVRAEVLADLGEGAGDLLTGRVTLEVVEGFPVLTLAEPFSWGDASPVRPTVGYERFLVRDGCDEAAVACSESGNVQVLALADGSPGAPELTDDQRATAVITTRSVRSSLDASYLDPGPLSRRLAADLVWTGEEMIVWGGRESPDQPNDLIDGAAFDPETDEWRLLASPPILRESLQTKAIWADDEMIVVSPIGTYGYDPDRDEWRLAGEGVQPPASNDRIRYLDGRLFVWDRISKINVLDLGSGLWRQIESPPPSRTEDGLSGFFGSLRVLDSRLIAITVAGGRCEGKSHWERHGDQWAALPDVSLATSEYADCSLANQAGSASGELVIWDHLGHPTMAYSTSRGGWRELAPIPLDGAEGPSGPLRMGDNHFLVPRWGEAAIFDGEAGEWVHVGLPGQGSDAEMVWTGQEILAWGVWETFDAWRWRPDTGLIGGDDAR